MKMVETFCSLGYGAVLGPLLLSMYLNIHWYLRSVSNGEAPLRENCEVVRYPADHTLLHWGYAIIQYGTNYVLEWCPFFLRMEIEAVRVVIPTPAPVPAIEEDDVSMIQASVQDPPAIESYDASIESDDASMMEESLQMNGELIKANDAVEHLEDEFYAALNGTMSVPSDEVIANIILVKETQTKGKGRRSVGSKAHLSVSSSGFWIVILCLLGTIGPVHANYHGAFETRQDYLNTCTLFVLLTQSDKALYWLVWRLIILYRSHMDEDSLREFVIPVLPKPFVRSLRRLKRDAIRTVRGGTVEDVYITREIMGRCRSVIRELCPAGKDPRVFLQESFRYQSLLRNLEVCFKSFRANRIRRVEQGEFDNDEDETPISMNSLFPSY